MELVLKHRLYVSESYGEVEPHIAHRKFIGHDLIFRSMISKYI
jgi:hypothetical protein